MMRALVVVVVVTGCMETVEPPVTVVDDRGESIGNACDRRTLSGCENSDACTWCASVGASCTPSYTPFCDGGLGWCTDAVCRSFCNAVDLPRCPDGMIQDHRRVGESDLCVCVPG